jgi:DHA2 family methylenomycin A resistance protein-like MFS transporter
MTKDVSQALGRATVAAGFGFGLVQLDVTIVNVALPAIAKVLGSDLSELQWVVDAYALIFAAALLSAGFLGDQYGARKIYLGGIALFAAASLGAGLAPNSAALIGARALQGLAAAAMLPCSLALINHAAGDSRSRATAIAWWTAAGSIALALGPIVGGMLVGVASWRSIFLVNLPICLIGALLTLRVPEIGRLETRKRGLDLPGQVLVILALAGITGAVIEAGPLGLDPITFGIGAVGIAAAVAFVPVEARSRAPMLPLKLFSDRNFSTATFYGVAMNLTFYGAIFVFSLYLQRVLGYSAVETGLAYLPLSVTLFFANLVSGRCVAKLGSRMPMALGAVIDAAGFALLRLAGTSTSYWLLLPAFVLIAAGTGLGVPAMSTAVLASVEKKQSGVASAVLNAARQAGGAIGVALFGTLAGDGRDHVVSGMHQSSFIAIGLLVVAAALALIAVQPQSEMLP